MSAALLVMCGLAFSGKSTIAGSLSAALDAELISLDDINDERGLWGGHGMTVAEWQRTHEIARGRLKAAIAMDRAVIVDDTSNLRMLRDGYRELARMHGVPFALILVSTPPDDIARRRAMAATTGERRGVDDAVFAEHAATFEEPQIDETPLIYRPGDSVETFSARLAQNLTPAPSPPRKA